MIGLSLYDVQLYARMVGLRTGPTGHVGAEAEWLVVDPERPHGTVPIAEIHAALKDLSLPAGGRLSYEPGGQVEISTQVHNGPVACVEALAKDREAVEGRLADAGLLLLGLGTDPVREPKRQVGDARFFSTQRYLEARGPTGLAAMCSTASLQVCVDIGVDAADAARRWRVANAIGPVLLAAFANSPAFLGRRTGWKSTRQVLWNELDPVRCPTRPLGGTDPARAWCDLLLASPVLVTGGGITFPEWTLRDWLAGSGPLRQPTLGDLELHASTVFPPVRPRGWFEFRMIDQQEAAHGAVPIAVVAALMDSAAGAERALPAAEPVAGLWDAAARRGLGDERLGLAAGECFRAAVEALAGMGAGELAGAVAAFAERYTFRGRSPADD